MTEERPAETENQRGLNRWLTLFVCAAVLGSASAAAYYFFTTEPVAERAASTRETAMLVQVTEAEAGNFHPRIEARGRVAAVEDIVLSPRVSGEIIELSPDFAPGRFVSKGETLLKIDPSDYENALARRESELLQAKADLAIEQGLQDVARQEYELLNENLAGQNEALVLRKPQLNIVRAAVQSAEASVNQAKLDLRRTEIKAPFDAHILARNVNVGSQVAAGDHLGRLAGVDEYWVVATLPLEKLPWIDLTAGEAGKGSPATVRNETAWPEGVHRMGYVDRLIGELEDNLRMARLLVTVPDPLLRKGGADSPPLIIGEFMLAEIQGKELKNVLRLDRDYIHADDTVWTMEDGALRIKKAVIPFRDARYAYISGGLSPDAKVVTTNLSTVAEGAPLRVDPADGKGTGP